MRLTYVFTTMQRLAPETDQIPHDGQAAAGPQGADAGRVGGTPAADTRGNGRPPGADAGGGGKPPAADTEPDAQPAHESPRTVGWRLGVLRRVEAMEAELDSYPDADVAGSVGRRIRTTLAAARATCGTHPPTWHDWWGLREGWSGCRVERAWQLVHEARSRMPVIAPTSELARLRTFAKDAASGLPRTDGRRVAIEADALGTRLTGNQPAPGDRWLISDTIRGAYQVADERFIALRAWRNRLYLTAIGVVVALIGLTLALTRWPTVAPLCFAQPSGVVPTDGSTPGTVPLCPTGLQAAGTPPTSRDVLVVIAAGVLGALLVAIAAIRKGSPSASAYRLTPALTALRLPLGGVTAVVGLLLAQGATKIGIEPITSQAELLVAALVFGIAQEPITSLLEARARKVQDEANDTTTDTGTST